MVINKSVKLGSVYILLVEKTTRTAAAAMTASVAKTTFVVFVFPFLMGKIERNSNIVCEIDTSKLLGGGRY